MRINIFVLTFLCFLGDPGTGPEPPLVPAEGGGDTEGGEEAKDGGKPSGEPSGVVPDGSPADHAAPSGSGGPAPPNAPNDSPANLDTACGQGVLGSSDLKQKEYAKDMTAFEDKLQPPEPEVIADAAPLQPDKSQVPNVEYEAEAKEFKMPQAQAPSALKALQAQQNDPFQAIFPNARMNFLQLIDYGRFRQFLLMTSPGALRNAADPTFHHKDWGAEQWVRGATVFLGNAKNFGVAGLLYTAAAAAAGVDIKTLANQYNELQEYYMGWMLRTVVGKVPGNGMGLPLPQNPQGVPGMPGGMSGGMPGGVPGGVPGAGGMQIAADGSIPGTNVKAPPKVTSRDIQRFGRKRKKPCDIDIEKTFSESRKRGTAWWRINPFL